MFEISHQSRSAFSDGKITINIIGAGRVGCTLARLWHLQGCFRVQAVCNTTLASAQDACGFIGSGVAHAEIATLPVADVWMLAVPDSQIAATAQRLADWQGATQFVASGGAKDAATGTAPSPSGLAGSAVPAVFHCSGALASDILAPLASLGWAAASLHCILSFATKEAALAQFPGTVCALEGDGAVVELLQAAMTAVGARCFRLAGGDKLLYHAAAVFATNFMPVLQQLAEDAWRSTGMPGDWLEVLRGQLLRNAVANITALGPKGALTGPAARGDTAAIARQAVAVSAWDAEAGAAYRALSDLALRMANSSKDAAATKATTF